MRSKKKVSWDRKCALDDVVIFELLEKADLANCGARDALVFCFEPNLLQRDDVARIHVARLVDDAICTF